jgi:Cu(I)/Ag(I) efflux system membrane fusion protein/cobalt-zinc-cadmium efflux system membrane fusion protein
MNDKYIISLISIGIFIALGVSLDHLFVVPKRQAGSDDALLVATAQATENVLKAGSVDPQSGKKIKYWVAPMDPTYIRNEPGKSPMGMDLVPVYEEDGEEKLPASTIRIDPVTVQNMGVRFGHVKRKVLEKEIRTVGNITQDETRMYAVNTKFNGWIEKLYVDFVGDKVKKGQPLFDIYSPELVSAQEEYLLAYDQYTSVRDSNYADIRQSAKRLLDAANKRLRYWDLRPYQIEALRRTGKVNKTLTIYSPTSGVVIDKVAFEGHNVKAGEHLYEIADLSKVWVDVDVYEYDLPWIQKGMPAVMELAYIPGKQFTGEVLFVYPYLETKTRTIKLRLAFPNDDDALKPGMYANVILKSKLPDSSLVIPQQAVIDSGTRQIVFVALGNGRFEPRHVKTGIEGNHNELQVLDGLKEDEEIVVSGQFMLDSESRLREAIQKMLDVRTRETAAPSLASSNDDDLDMSDMTMDDAEEELDMSDMTMEDASPPQ